MKRDTEARRQKLRLERLRQAIGGRTSVTPLEVFVALGLPAHLFDRNSDERIRAVLAEVGFVNRRSITDRANASRYATETGRDKARQASRTVKARRIATGEVAEYERERYASHPQHQLAHKVRSRFAHALRRYGKTDCAETVEDEPFPVAAE